MYRFRELWVVSCLFALSANIFAAAEVTDASDRWSQELAQYEAVYNDAHQYFGEPVDDGRVPSSAIFLGVQDGYRRYQLPETSAYLFGVTSPAQRKDLMEKTDFLFRLIYSCAQIYSIKPIDVQSGGALQQEFSSTQEMVLFIVKNLCVIANSLKNQDYVDERDLNSLFKFIDSAIYELNKSKSSNDLIDLMYAPIKGWITDNFPGSPMLKYIENRADLSRKASGGYNLLVNYAFKYGEYFNEYHSQTSEYKKITEWLDGTKAGLISSENKIIADRELKEFERVITLPVDASQIPVGTKGADDVFAAFIRYIESLHQMGEALLEKWIGIIDSEKEEAERLAQERTAQRLAKTAKPKKVDPKEALAAMMRDLGLEEDDQSEKSFPKAKKGEVKKAKPTPKEAKAEIERQRQEAERARALRDAEEAERLLEESRRLAELAATESQNAEKNAATELRKAELRERRNQERQNRKMIMTELLSRGARWIEALYDETQKLRLYKSSELIDPSIFRGNPDYKSVSDTLKAAGIYVKEQVHNNEKCVAMWKDQKGRNWMVWFDSPHGAQLCKGASAGWVISLHKALKESGRLLSERL